MSSTESQLTCAFETMDFGESSGIHHFEHQSIEEVYNKLLEYIDKY